MDVPNRVSWVSVAAGVLAILSPFVIAPSSSAAMWNLIATGAILMLAALAGMNAHGDQQTPNYWPAVGILAGIWLFVSTTFLAGNLALIWSNVVLGVIAIVAGLVSLSYERLNVHHDVPPSTHPR